MHGSHQCSSCGSFQQCPCPGRRDDAFFVLGSSGNATSSDFLNNLGHVSYGNDYASTSTPNSLPDISTWNRKYFKVFC